MSSSIPNSPRRSCSRFQKVVDGFFKQTGLPFAEVLTAKLIEEVFRKHDAMFGSGAIYCTATVLWAFVGQVLRDGKMAACQSAVAAIIAHRQLIGLSVPTEDTGDYCRARAKLNEKALHELTCTVAQNAETEADQTWLTNGRHVKLIDGFTFTMPDTAENQREYPQAKTQRPGIGFPIARCVAVLSLATACVLDLAIGPYAGKETGETALLRTLMKTFLPTDIALFDRYYCSFMVIAAMISQGTDVCTRNHHLRQSDFRRGKRLGKCDHLIVWQRPQCPKWMDEETYQSIPETIVLRELQFSIIEPGFRTKSIIVITTLIDPNEFSQEDIANLYGYRWNVELDIRSIKSNLNLDHVRCKSPEMVRRELWTTLLAYNLIRSTAASAALLHDIKPRQISFTATVQFVLQEWSLLAKGWLSKEMLIDFSIQIIESISKCIVGNRPGRIEPRVLKRRPKPYKRMTKPRHVLKKQLLNS
jgi:putative transposase